MEPECPKHERKKLYSWGMNQNPKKLRMLIHPPKCLETPDHMNSLTLQIHLPLHPQHQINIVTSPRTPGDPGTELDPSICQPQSSKSQWLDSCEHWGKGRATKLVVGIQVPPPYEYWAPLWHSGKRAGKKADCSFQATHHPERKHWGLQNAPLSLTSLGCGDYPLIASQYTGPQTHLYSKEAQDNDTGLGSQWCTIPLGAPRNTLQHSPGPLRCLAPLIEKDYLFDASIFEVVEEKLMISSNPAQEVGQAGKKTGPYKEWATALHTPNQPEEALELVTADGLGVMAIVL